MAPPFGRARAHAHTYTCISLQTSVTPRARAAGICVASAGRASAPRKVYDDIMVYVCARVCVRARAERGWDSDNIRNRVPARCTRRRPVRETCGARAHDANSFFSTPIARNPHARSHADPLSVGAPFREIDCSIFPRVFLSVSALLLLLFRTDLFSRSCAHTHAFEYLCINYAFNTIRYLCTRVQRRLVHGSSKHTTRVDTRRVSSESTERGKIRYRTYDKHGTTYDSMTVKIKHCVVCVSNAAERTSLIPTELGWQTKGARSERDGVFVCTIISEGSKIGTGNGERGRFPVLPP